MNTSNQIVKVLAEQSPSDVEMIRLLFQIVEAGMVLMADNAAKSGKVGAAKLIIDASVDIQDISNEIQKELKAA